MFTIHRFSKLKKGIGSFSRETKKAYRINNTSKVNNYGYDNDGKITMVNK